MKIRLAKKIMKQARTDIPWTNLYWRTRIEIHDLGHGFILDHRISKAKKLTTRWDARKRMKEERCCGNCLWIGCEDILGNGWCYKKDCETSCDKVCKKHEF